MTSIEVLAISYGIRVNLDLNDARHMKLKALLDGLEGAALVSFVRKGLLEAMDKHAPGGTMTIPQAFTIEFNRDNPRDARVMGHFKGFHKASDINDWIIDALAAKLDSVFHLQEGIDYPLPSVVVRATNAPVNVKVEITGLTPENLAKLSQSLLNFSKGKED